MSLYYEFSPFKAEEARDDSERVEDRLIELTMECPDLDPPDGDKCPFSEALYGRKEKAALAAFDCVSSLRRQVDEDAPEAESRLQQRIDQWGSDESAARDRVRWTMEISRIGRARRLLNGTVARLTEALQQADQLRHPDVRRLY